MESQDQFWTKPELQIYILLLCAHADGVESDEEVKLIKSKTDEQTYAKMHEEFMADTEDERFTKIEENIHKHAFSEMELGSFRREIYGIFFADCNFNRMEKYLDRILDNILY